MNDKKYITPANIWHRLKSESPTFFKKLRRLMVLIGLIGGALEVVPANHTEWLPGNLISILITIGAVGTVLTSLPVSNPNNNPKID